MRGSYSCIATLLCAIFALLPATALGQKPAMRSVVPAIAGGVYDDGLLIGFDPATRIVTGYFQSETGAGQFSCIFYLTGRTAATGTRIATYFPETPADRINGVLVQTDSKKISVRLAEEHGGCWNVQHFADKEQPADFDLQAAHPWIAVAVVKSAKAYFYNAPASATPRRAHIVRGDGVGIRAVRGQWLQVDFVSGNKPVSGWIKQSKIYPSTGRSGEKAVKH